MVLAKRRQAAGRQAGRPNSIQPSDEEIFRAKKKGVKEGVEKVTTYFAR